MYVNFDVDVQAVALEVVELVARARAGAPRTPPPVLDVREDVLIGAEDELFLARGSHLVLDYVTGRRQPVPTSLRAFSANIETRRRLADEIGARYVHVIFPDKQSVMAEAFPVPGIRCLGELYRERCAHVWRDVLYPRQALRGAGRRVFQRTDTHLNAHGTLVVVAELLRHLEGDAMAARTEALVAHMKEPTERSGDLGRKLEPPHTEQVQHMGSNPSWLRYNNDAQLEGGNSSGVEIVLAPTAPDPRRVMLIGDSFMRDVVGPFAYLFREVVFLRSPFVHEEIVRGVRPDILISGNVERYLATVEHDLDRPSFQMMNALSRGAPEQRRFARAFSAMLVAESGTYRKFMDNVMYGAT